MLLFSSVKFSSHLILNIMYLKLFFFFLSGCICGGGRFTAPTVSVLFAIKLLVF